MKKKVTSGILILLVTGLIAASGAFAGDETYTGFFSSAAAGGYDPVAYFIEGKAVKGADDYSLSYKGADWYFKSIDNLNAFKADPARYAPQYGGYCAWAVAEGYLAKGDPLFWHIHKGKLYLNYNREIKNRWLKSVPDFVNKADVNWPGVIR